MILTSPDKHSIVKIAKGELVSYKKNEEELIHQKGDPGWRNSDTEMFPVIGATAKSNFTIPTPKGNAIQDQHGLLRELDYKLMERNETSATFKKVYKKNTATKNSKFPEKSAEQVVSWPYSFTFEKRFSLTNESLSISFNINSEKGMPYMLGYHPAFKLSGTSFEILQTSTQKITLQEILKAGSLAFPVLNCNKIELIKEKGFNIAIKTEGFNNFMCWTEVTNMLCIEPITRYPNPNKKELFSNLFHISKGSEIFNVEIKPF